MSAIIDDKLTNDGVLQKSQSRAESKFSTSGVVGQVSQTVHLDRNRFNIWGAVGVQWAATASPLTICSTLQLVIGVGGSPFYFWAFIVAAFFQFLVVLSLAELASAYPHTSGQAYWTSKLATPRLSRFLTYWVGLCAFWGWMFGLTGSAVFGAQFILSIGTLVTGTYSPELWHVYLMVVAFGAWALVGNTVGIRVFSKLTFPSLLFLNAATIFIFVTLLTKTSPKASASTVFVDVINHTGWNSEGIVFLLSLLPGSIAISAFDAPTHASDEMPDPAKQVPKVMVGTSILNITSTMIMIVGVLFCLHRPENLLEPLAGLAFLQVCWDSWANLGFVITVASIYGYVNLFATISMVYTCSRLIWAFAHTGGLHRRDWLLHVNPRLQVPVNAVMVTVVVMFILNLLVLGPSTVLNAMFGAGGFFFVNSFAIPIILLLIRGRKTLPENRSFHLGRFGLLINVLAVCFCILLATIINFPTFIPVTALTMNWSPGYVVIITGLTVGNWFLVRHAYKPPPPLYSDAEIPIVRQPEMA